MNCKYLYLIAFGCKFWGWFFADVVFPERRSAMGTAASEEEKAAMDGLATNVILSLHFFHGNLVKKRKSDFLKLPTYLVSDLHIFDITS